MASVARAVKAEPQRPASAGSPMPESVRLRIEASLGADLRGVRVHRGPQAAAAAEKAGARAFTFGNDIYLGARESPQDMELMAHEAAHVLQQQGRAVIQRAGGGSEDRYEREAAGASSAVRGGAAFNVKESTGGARVQRLGVMDFLESKAWSLLEEHAPELVPILRKGPEGVFDWLKERITSAFEAMFDNLMAPVRAIAGAGKWLSGHFGPLLAWMQEAAAKIARNDCSPFREAADKIEAVLTALITPIVEKIRAVADKVRVFLSGVWEKFGAPVWDWIKKFAGQQWEQIQRFASWVWDKTEPVRRLLDRAWTWLKNKIGIGEGPEGQNGVLQWVQRKAEAAWDWVKVRLEPYKKQLLTAAAVLGGILVLISPAGPVVVVGGIIIAVVQGVRWIKANWGKGDLVVRARVYLEKTLIPALMAQLNRLTAAVTRMAGSLNGKLGELAAGAGALVSTVAESALKFAVNAMMWIAEQAIELARWASEKLTALSEWIQKTVTRVLAILQPMLDFLGKVAGVVFDIYTLPLMLAGKAWNAIPSCIRDPFIDFIGPIILKQIAIFQELVRDNEAWQKTKADVGNIIRLVFKDHDLLGAIKAVFHLILRVFNFPLDLAIVVLKKAASAWDVVLAKPIAFIKNAVRSVAHGFKLLWKNLWGHLAYGVEGWLFGELADKGIAPPKSWTNPMDLLGFVFDVLGLSMNHIFELLKKRFDKDKVDKLQVWFRRIGKAWQWVKEIIDTSKSPAEVTAGLIKQAVGFAGSILTSVVSWIVGKVGAEIAAMAGAAAATAGISEIVDIARRIYIAIVSAIRWMRKILEMVNTALDSVMEIAAGAIESAGGKLESVMHRAMPIVISFLGDQFGLGGIGEKMREIVDKLRAKVDEALLWIIDKVKAGIDALIGLVKSAAKALYKWWTASVDFESEGVTHTIFTKGEPPNVRVIVKSDETDLDNLVAEVATKKPSLSKKAEAQRDVVQGLMKDLADLSAKGMVADNAEFAKAKEDRDRAFIDKSKALDTALMAMADILTQAGVVDDWTPEESTYKSGPSGRPDTAKAFITSNRRKGSAPEGGGAFPVGWQFLLTTNQVHTGGRANSKNFVKMHLINHNLGGLGVGDNLTPGPNRANGEMERWFEKPMKRLVGEEQGEPFRGAIKVNIEVHYGRASNPHSGKWKGTPFTYDEADFPDRITGDFSYCFRPKKKGKFTPGGVLDLSLEPPMWD